MPIYEYQCQSCGQHTEVIQKLSDEPLVDCPNCGEAAMKKKVSAAAFRLKGGGWYETDFKTSNKRNLAGDQKTDGAKKTDKADGSKTEKSDKPAAKPVESASSKSSSGGDS